MMTMPTEKITCPACLSTNAATNYKAIEKDWFRYNSHWVQKFVCPSCHSQLRWGPTLSTTRKVVHVVITVILIMSAIWLQATGVMESALLMIWFAIMLIDQSRHMTLTVIPQKPS
ncbi:MAG: hypothetical protein Q8J78_09290 [Moraxellaceae bacterium]|nr:hypothetical protein [Moraxellaceae bacterium]